MAGWSKTTDWYATILRGDLCTYCMAVVATTCNHIAPRRRAHKRHPGTDNWTNLTAGCPDCNQQKGDMGRLLRFLVHHAKFTHALLGLALMGSVAGCSGSPTSNTPAPIPSASTWNLSGTVSSSAGGGINAATVAILDGPDAGKQTAADANGRYTFAGLQQAGFSLRASAPGFTAVTRGVTLTSSSVADFQLPRLPVATLSYEGDIGFTNRADGGSDMFGTAVNTGNGCAQSISGSTTLTGSTGLVRTFAWSLPPAIVVRPGERFRYTFGPISLSDLTQFGSGGSYVTRFTFTSGVCS